MSQSQDSPVKFNVISNEIVEQLDFVNAENAVESKLSTEESADSSKEIKSHDECVNSLHDALIQKVNSISNEMTQRLDFIKKENAVESKPSFEESPDSSKERKSQCVDSLQDASIQKDNVISNEMINIVDGVDNHVTESNKLKVNPGDIINVLSPFVNPKRENREKRTNTKGWWSMNRTLCVTFLTILTLGAIAIVTFNHQNISKDFNNTSVIKNTLTNTIHEPKFSSQAPNHLLNVNEKDNDDETSKVAKNIFTKSDYEVGKTINIQYTKTQKEKVGKSSSIASINEKVKEEKVYDQNNDNNAEKSKETPENHVTSMSDQSQKILDSKLTIMKIKRSKNDNVIIYQANLTSTGVFNEIEPMNNFWLKITPDYIEKHRKKGKKDDRTEMIWYEKIPFGFKTEKKGTQEFLVTFNACPDYKFTLKWDKLDNRPYLFVIHPETHELWIVTRMFAKTTSMFGYTVEYIDLFGINAVTREELTYRHVKK